MPPSPAYLLCLPCLPLLPKDYTLPLPPHACLPYPPTYCRLFCMACSWFSLSLDFHLLSRLFLPLLHLCLVRLC